jgi:hypothetical protein
LGKTRSSECNPALLGKIGFYLPFIIGLVQANILVFNLAPRHMSRDMKAIDGVVMPRQSLKVLFSILIDQVALHFQTFPGLRIALMPWTEK